MNLLPDAFFITLGNYVDIRSMIRLLKIVLKSECDSDRIWNCLMRFHLGDIPISIHPGIFPYEFIKKVCDNRCEVCGRVTDFMTEIPLKRVCFDHNECDEGKSPSKLYSVTGRWFYKESPNIIVVGGGLMNYGLAKLRYPLKTQIFNTLHDALIKAKDGDHISIEDGVVISDKKPFSIESSSVIHFLVMISGRGTLHLHQSTLVITSPCFLDGLTVINGWIEGKYNLVSIPEIEDSFPGVQLSLYGRWQPGQSKRNLSISSQYPIGKVYMENCEVKAEYGSGILVNSGRLSMSCSKINMCAYSGICYRGIDPFTVPEIPSLSKVKIVSVGSWPIQHEHKDLCIETGYEVSNINILFPKKEKINELNDDCCMNLKI